MVQKYVLQVSDDLDGTVMAAEAAETVRFGLDGVDYLIDLNSEHAAELRAVFERFVAAGRPDTASRVTFTGGQSAVREWANANGFHLKERGRIPVAVLKAYEARH